MASRIKFLCILLFTLILFPHLYGAVIAGIVREKETEEPLPYATVIIENHVSGFTDENGFFSFIVEKGDSFDITVLYGSYNPYHTTVKGEGKIFLDDIFLDRKIYKLKHTVVKSTKKSLERPHTSFTLTSSSFRNIPSFIEEDITSVLSTLPGVVKRNDFSSALYIMGGKPAQNLILLDNAVMYSPYHLGGIFSTFNSYSVKSVNLLSGNFPAEFGNRISAVMQLTTKDGRKDRFSGGGEISLISTKLFLEGPLTHNWTFFLTARRTYIDALISTGVKLYELFTGNESDFIFPYYFYDVNFSTSYKPNINTRIKFSAMTGSDIIYFKEDSFNIDMKWTNTVYNLSLYKFMPPTSSVELDLSYSMYRNLFDVMSLLTSDNSIKTPSIKLKYLHKLSFIKPELLIEYRKPVFSYSTEISVDTTRNWEYQQTSSYIAGGLTVGIEFIPNVFVVKPGIRETYYFERKEYAFSPRIESSYGINENTIIYAALGKYYQNMSTLRREGNFFSSFLGDLWFSIDSQYPLTSSETFTTGIKHWIKGVYPLKIEYYYRRMNNIYSFTGEKNDPYILKSEDGLSTGLMAMIQKKEGKWSGWLSYTFSITVMQDSTGNWYYPIQDQRHNIQILSNYSINKNFSGGIHIALGSGMPFTGPVGDYVNYSDYYNFINCQYDTLPYLPISVVKSDHNQMRFPWYKRVDVNLTYSFTIKRFKGSVFLNIINVFNTPNPVFYYYDTFQNPPVRYSFYMPIIPTLGIRGEI